MNWNVRRLERGKDTAEGCLLVPCFLEGSLSFVPCFLEREVARSRDPPSRSQLELPFSFENPLYSILLLPIVTVFDRLIQNNDYSAKAHVVPTKVSWQTMTQHMLPIPCTVSAKWLTSRIREFGELGLMKHVESSGGILERNKLGLMRLARV